MCFSSSTVIQETIIDFWKEHVSPVVKLKDYALDLVLIPRSSTPEDPYMELKPFIIEINPLAEFTGSGLFKVRCSRLFAICGVSCAYSCCLLPVGGCS